MAGAEAGQWGQKGSAGLGDAFQKRGVCNACVCILSTVDGYLRIPPFLSVKQYYFLRKPAVWASWKQPFYSLRRCRPPVAGDCSIWNKNSLKI